MVMFARVTVRLSECLPLKEISGSNSGACMNIKGYY
jgi:hypothetical protein